MISLLWLALMAGPAAPAGAATATPPRHQERIVVTAVASRAAEALDATPATVSVIEREALERAVARDIREALRYEPGISVESSPARFGAGNIAIRGLEGNRVQMLQDGVRLPDGYRVGSFSNAGRNAFDTALMSRIEVLRGPGSALYGSDALAGVVSTTTIDPADLLGKRAAGGFVEAGYASVDDSAWGTGGIAARFGAVDALVAGSRAEGHERDNRGDVETMGSTRTAPNPQDARSDTGLAKLAFGLPGGARARLAWDRYEREVATDVRSLNPQSPRSVSLAADDRASRERLSADVVAYGLGPVERLSVLAYRQRSKTAQGTVEERANTTAQCLSAPGTVRCRREALFRFEQDEVGVTAIGESATRGHRVVYGAEHARIDTEESRDGRQTNLNTGAVTNIVGTDIFPTRDFPRSRTERSGAFVQDEIALGRATLVPALRYDRFDMRPEPDGLYIASNPGRTTVSATDSAWSPRLGAVVPLDAQTSLTLLWASGFRAPPYFDLNVGLSNLPLGYAVIANADLRPEKSRGAEVGLRGRHDAFDYTLTAFRTDYSDLIVSRAPLPCPGDPRCVPGAPITFQSQNVTRARIEGVEARAALRLAREWSARAGAAWARGDDRTRNVPLNSVDPAKVVLGLAWERGGLGRAARMGAEAHVTHAARKSRIDTSAGVLFPAPSYTVLDLTGFVRVGRKVTVHAGVFNLFDRKYWLWSDVRGVLNPGASIDRYTQAGRGASVQVKLEF